MTHKKSISLFIFFCLTTLSFSQDNIWEKRFDFDGNDYGYDGRPTSDGGFIVTGDIGIFTPWEENNQYLLLKVDSLGNEEWSNILSGDEHGRGYTGLEVSEGGYITGGVMTQENASEILTVIKTDEEGNPEWNTFLDIPGVDQSDGMIHHINYIIEVSTGGYLVLGKVTTDTWLSFLVKLSPNGEQEWVETYGNYGADASPLLAKVVEIQNQGFAFVTGKFESTPDDYPIESIFLYLTDYDGNLILSKQVKEDNDFYMYTNSTIFIDDNAIYLNGIRRIFDEDEVRPYLMKFDYSGNMIWDTIVPKTFTEFGDAFYNHSACLDEDGNIMVFAFHLRYPERQHYFSKMSAEDGSLISQTPVQGMEASFKFLNQLYKLDDGGYFISGQDRKDSDNYDVYVLRTNEQGNIISSNEQIETSLDIHIYPNPVSNEIFIDFPENSISGQVVVRLINQQGVTLIESEIRDTERSIDISSLPPSLYFLEVDMNNEFNILKRVVKFK